MAKELTCDDRVALKGWEKFSQSKEKELDSIVKTVMEKHAMGLVRDCSSFNDSGILSTEDLDSVVEVLAYYCQTREVMQRDVAELVSAFFESDATRPLLTEFLTSLHDEFVKRIGGKVKSLAEMWGKIDRIKKEYNYED